MYRVRKLNRKLPVVARDAHFRRPRLADFQQAFTNVVRKASFERVLPSAAELKRLNRNLHSPRGAISAVDTIKHGNAGVVLVPVSEQSCVPSLAEVVRVATGHGLVDILERRDLHPCALCVWPGIPASFDNGPRCVVDRNGQAIPTAGAVLASADEVEKLLAHLPHTEFTPWLLELLREVWDEDPLVMKLRLLMKLFGDWPAMAIASSFASRQLPGMIGERRPRLTYRAHLGHVLEQFPVISVVSPLEGGSLTVDSSAAAALGGQFVHFPSVSTTLVEGKVERWLDKYSLKPEQLLSKVQPVELVNSIFPSDPIGTLKASRETLLAKLFQLENDMESVGFGKSAQSIDKIANRLDAQFDQLAAAIKTNSRSEREIAVNQLTKARSYLRPLGRPQGPSMSIVHYLNFYGPDFPQILASSLEISDGRHHLVYLGA